LPWLVQRSVLPVPPVEVAEAAGVEVEVAMAEAR
jgi:hypothetical protein